MTNKEQEFSILNREEMSPVVIKTELRAEYFEDIDEIENNIYLYLSTDQLRSGLIRNLGNDEVKNKGASAAINFAVLLAIAAHMNYKGKAFPSQRRICAMTGLSRTTVIKAINDLQDIKIGGKPILRVTKEKNIRNFDKNNYFFDEVDMPIDVETVFE